MLMTLLTLVVLFALCGPGCAPTGVYHVVEPGQTLYRIARAYDIDENRLARVNGVVDPKQLEVGRRLFIPGASLPKKVSAVEPAKPSSPAKTTAPPATKSKPAAKTAKDKQSPPVNKAKGEDKSQASQLPQPGTFVWPVRGKVVSEFGVAAGKSNKGIEIAVPQGTPVVASAPGKVIYSGNGIRGYGNLVILEHGDNYFTVYGFNNRNLVMVNSYVGQGQQIALSGTPSGGKSPRLHFEIRNGKTAVNPIFYLP